MAVNDFGTGSVKRRIIAQALPLAAALSDSLPLELRRKYDLAALEFAIKTVHRPAGFEELELAQRVSDTVVCVVGDRIDRIGTPEEIFTRAYIAKLYQMEHGKYDPCFDSLEFVP